jgi:hypothetical protein
MNGPTLTIEDRVSRTLARLQAHAAFIGLHDDTNVRAAAQTVFDAMEELEPIMSAPGRIAGWVPPTVSAPKEKGRE